MIEPATDAALRDLALQTGPIGGLLILLGVLVRSWLTGILDQMKSLQKDVHELVKTRAETSLDVRDLMRRVERLEGGPPMERKPTT